MHTWQLYARVFVIYYLKPKSYNDTKNKTLFYLFFAFDNTVDATIKYGKFIVIVLLGHFLIYAYSRKSEKNIFSDNYRYPVITEIIENQADK